jgi:hypothetical protein
MATFISTNGRFERIHRANPSFSLRASLSQTPSSVSRPAVRSTSMP